MRRNQLQVAAGLGASPLPPIEPDIWSVDDARRIAADVERALRAEKVLEAVDEGPKLGNGEEAPSGSMGPGLGDLMNLLFRIEDRLERVEQKLDRLSD